MAFVELGDEVKSRGEDCDPEDVRLSKHYAGEAEKDKRCVPPGRREVSLV